MISVAFAQDAAAQPSTIMSIVPLIAIFGIFYFLMIRPQQKKAKEQKLTVEALAIGDEVLVNSGIVGKVRAIKDNYIDLEISKDTVIKIQKFSVVQVFPKGSFD